MRFFRRVSNKLGGFLGEFQNIGELLGEFQKNRRVFRRISENLGELLGEFQKN